MFFLLTEETIILHREIIAEYQKKAAECRAASGIEQLIALKELVKFLKQHDIYFDSYGLLVHLDTLTDGDESLRGEIREMLLPRCGKQLKLASEENDPNLSKVREFLRRQSQIKLFLNTGTAFGNQASLLTTMERLRELGFQGDFVIVYARDEALTQIKVLLGGAEAIRSVSFKKQDVDKIPYTDISFSVGDDCNVSDLATLEGKKAAQYRSGAIVTIQPTDWDVAQRLGESVGLITSGVEFPLKYKPFSNSLEVEKKSLPARSRLVEHIQRLKKSNNAVLQFVYGLHQCKRISRSELLRLIISANLHVAQRTLRPSLVVLVLEGFSNTISELGGEDAYLVDLKESKLFRDKVNLLCFEKLPRSEFEALLFESDFPPICEGVNTKNMLDRHGSWLLCARRVTPFVRHAIDDSDYMRLQEKHQRVCEMLTSQNSELNVTLLTEFLLDYHNGIYNAYFESRNRLFGERYDKVSDTICSVLQLLPQNSACTLNLMAQQCLWLGRTGQLDDNMMEILYLLECMREIESDSFRRVCELLSPFLKKICNQMSRKLSSYFAPDFVVEALKYGAFFRELEGVKESEEYRHFIHIFSSKVPIDQISALQSGIQYKMKLQELLSQYHGCDIYEFNNEYFMVGFTPAQCAEFITTLKASKESARSSSGKYSRKFAPQAYEGCEYSVSAVDQSYVQLIFNLYGRQGFNVPDLSSVQMLHRESVIKYELMSEREKKRFFKDFYKNMLAVSELDQGVAKGTTGSALLTFLDHLDAFMVELSAQMEPVQYATTDETPLQQETVLSKLSL